MGFGVTSLKNMRKFYEAWATIEGKSPTAVADLQNTENETIVIRQPELPNFGGFPLSEFMAVPFSHHISILENEAGYFFTFTKFSHNFFIFTLS